MKHKSIDEKIDLEEKLTVSGVESQLRLLPAHCLKFNVEKTYATISVLPIQVVATHFDALSHIDVRHLITSCKANTPAFTEVQKLQLFAWQSAARGNDVHLNANPTQGQILHHQYKDKKEEIRETTKVGILAKYGGEQFLEKAPKELLQGQTEEYVEYSRTGQVIKGREKIKARSKYHEDGECRELWANTV